MYYNNTSNAYDTYKNNQVNTASRKQLLLMLFDGAIKFLNFAAISIDNKNVPDTHKYIVKAEDIIQELMSTLNFDAGDIAKDLYNLYDYLYNELIQANMKKDKEKVLYVKSMMEELRETWAQI
ncbi:flagellar export chaperone FliS [Clostridium grantii]|uniref:Flagellar protein FliS n=1 Tax=Clostridium grantii DSM 8605 TaxID=1121316 RepID=A0A1M5W7Q5_9CLOT|nr:flagellar export chaperone FliS [Clostridium grantii]SHH83491.1 flagellar protein FliS [Clostridium grantii DSM 8605]